MERDREKGEERNLSLGWEVITSDFFLFDRSKKKRILDILSIPNQYIEISWTSQNGKLCSLCRLSVLLIMILILSLVEFRLNNICQWSFLTRNVSKIEEYPFSMSKQLMINSEAFELFLKKLHKSANNHSMVTKKNSSRTYGEFNSAREKVCWTISYHTAWD